MFDMGMMFVACYNTFVNAYYSAFGTPTELHIIIIDYCVEFIFFLDLIFSCFQEYTDQVTYAKISDVKKIFMTYLKGNFLFDLISIIPFGILIPGLTRK